MRSDTGPLTRVLAGAIATTVLLGGCESLDDPERTLPRTDLVNDLAGRLEAAAGLAYSAEYALPGGGRGTISQTPGPRRAAYRYPGGMTMVGADALARCVTSGPRPTCTLDPPPGPTEPPPATALAAASRAGLVTPPVVISLLTATALDQDAVVEQRDTTVAGRHGSCVAVRQLANAATAAFKACVTSDGVLGSFTGVLDGRPRETALSSYRAGVDGGAFDLPAGAEVRDRRPGGR
ncbi:hypothetical protein ACFFWC_17480 [Plantactinospora siamensis]|uniref:PknH-like extracellular domain-containing protein n=1 Tax=Plantactinospora siamensis TaxID=555372 RepID=A0ABV6NPH0_9ACTN